MRLSTGQRFKLFFQVFFPDHTDEAIEVDSATRARDFCHKIGYRLGLKSSDGFSLFVKIKDKLLAVPETEFFFDFVRQLSDWVHTNHAMQKDSTMIPINYQVYFMRKLWFNVMPGNDPQADLIFHYFQVPEKVFFLINHQNTFRNVQSTFWDITRQQRSTSSNWQRSSYVPSQKTIRMLRWRRFLSWLRNSFPKIHWKCTQPASGGRQSAMRTHV